MKRIISTLLIVLLILTFVGCADMSERQQRTLSGGAIGAAGGAAITAIAGGSVWAGAALGGAAGAVTGYILGTHPKRHKKVRERE